MGASTSQSRTYPSASSLPGSAEAVGAGAPGASALMFAANLAGSFLNWSGHMLQQKPTVLPSTCRVNFGSTSLPLTGHFRLIGLPGTSSPVTTGALDATAAAGGGTIVSSSPRLIVTLGSDFFRPAAPSADTFVCHRYRFLRLFIPDRCASPASVTAVP